jgi:mannuronan 5-epimerase
LDIQKERHVSINKDNSTAEKNQDGGRMMVGMAKDPILTRRRKLQVLIMVALCQTLSLFVSYQGMYFPQNASAQQERLSSLSCVRYDPSEKIINVNCGHTNLTSINNQLNDPALLRREAAGGVWLLDAGITIQKGATFSIDSADVTWLKIAGDGEHAHAIRVLGSLNVDSVKISSWNPETDDYLKFGTDKRPPLDLTEEQLEINRLLRPYVYLDHANGRTNITNSELAYLGYDCNDSKCHGLSFLGSEMNAVKGNHIHHNNRGFYSSELGETILENNHVHTNYDYGIDPHTATHDMIIRNNTVHNNGGIGIICSLDCYNITMENNMVSNNVVAGMMLTRNTSNSVIRNNTITNESTGISISESDNNDIYNNTLIDIESGIDVKNESSENLLLENMIIRAMKYGIRVTDSPRGNILESNTIIDTPQIQSTVKEAQL